jgi:hypothetical protein
MTYLSKRMFFALFLGLFLAAQAEAQEKTMYRWTDENGVVHFTDVRPQEQQGQQVQEQVIPTDEPPAAPSPYSQSATTEPTLGEQRRAEITQKHQEYEVNEAMTSAECAAWQAEVDRLEPNRRVFFTNEQGETERMDDVERANRVAELKAQIARNCK